MKCTFAVEFYRTVKTLENCQFLHPSCFQINFQTILLKWMSQIIQDSLRGKKYGLTSTSQLYAFSLSILFNHTPVQQKPFLSSHIQTLLISLGAHLSAWHSWGLVFPLLRCLYQQYKFCHAFQPIHQCPATLRQRRSCAGYTRLPCNNAVFNEIFPCLSGHLTRFILFGLGFFELIDFQHK